MPMFVSGKFPTEADEKRLRLLLSTYTDGSGENSGLPGGFDFERVAAEWLDGKHVPGTKHIYDVVVEEGDKYYGYSCKMRNTLSSTHKQNDASSPDGETEVLILDDDAEGDAAGETEDAQEEAAPAGTCLIEVSNAGAKFLAKAQEQGLTLDNIADNTPQRQVELKEVGEFVVREIMGWHTDAEPIVPPLPRRTKAQRAFAATWVPPKYEAGSILLFLGWSKPPKTPVKPAEYQLFAFDEHMMTETELANITWHGRVKITKNKKTGKTKKTGALYGTRPTKDGKGQELAIEVYLFSGGHVKWYPRASDAIWRSKKFTLLEAPRRKKFLSSKAAEYFPEQWASAGGEFPEDLEAAPEEVPVEQLV